MNAYRYRMSQRLRMELCDLLTILQGALRPWESATTSAHYVYPGPLEMMERRLMELLATKEERNVTV